MDLNITPLFTWNHNLIFLWISAEYKTGNNEHTSVTVYDDIILRSNPRDHVVKIKNRLFEYPLIDVYEGLGEKGVEYFLNWEHMPVVGPIIKVRKFCFITFREELVLESLCYLIR